MKSSQKNLEVFREIFCFVKCLKKMLNKKIAIYVPSTKGENAITEKEHNQYVDYVASTFCALFGGATAEKTTGFWRNNNYRLIKENITIVYSFTDAETAKANKSNVVTIAEKIKAELMQECVSVEYNGQLLFI